MEQQTILLIIWTSFFVLYGVVRIMGGTFTRLVHNICSLFGLKYSSDQESKFYEMNVGLKKMANMHYQLAGLMKRSIDEPNTFGRNKQCETPFALSLMETIKELEKKSGGSKKENKNTCAQLNRLTTEQKDLIDNVEDIALQQFDYMELINKYIQQNEEVKEEAKEEAKNREFAQNPQMYTSIPLKSTRHMQNLKRILLPDVAILTQPQINDILSKHTEIIPIINDVIKSYYVAFQTEYKNFGELYRHPLQRVLIFTAIILALFQMYFQSTHLYFNEPFYPVNIYISHRQKFKYSENMRENFEANKDSIARNLGETQKGWIENNQIHYAQEVEPYTIPLNYDIPNDLDTHCRQQLDLFEDNFVYYFMSSYEQLKPPNVSFSDEINEKLPESIFKDPFYIYHWFPKFIILYHELLNLGYNFLFFGNKSKFTKLKKEKLFIDDNKKDEIFIFFPCIENVVAGGMKGIYIVDKHVPEAENEMNISIYQEPDIDDLII